MRLALATNRFYANHTVRYITIFSDGRRLRGLAKTRPTTTSIEFSAGFKQQGVATHAVIGSNFPVVFVFATLWPICSRITCDVKRYRFSIFSRKNSFPLNICFMNFHDEQLISMSDAHSGASPAHASCSGCSSKGV